MIRALLRLFRRRSPTGKRALAVHILNTTHLQGGF
jgi:hypothetical protein